MSGVPDLLARLQLRADATPQELRRAYARELKKIDQATQADAFQALRETYEQLGAWMARREAQAAGMREVPGSGPAEVRADATPPCEPAPQPTAAPQADLPAQPALEPAVEPAAEAAADGADAPPSPLAGGQQLLDLLVHRLGEQPFRDREEVERFLAASLDDERLSNVEARQYFEWGVASILAGGWRPGHELLFAPAAASFHWRDDRPRLLWLGRPGEIVDAAIEQMRAWDAQPARDRDRQRPVIRALRGDARPRTSQLLAWVPLAQQLHAHFPAWLYVVSRPSQLERWLAWDKEIPAWRRRLSAHGRKQRKGAVPSTPARDGFSWTSGMVLAAIVVGALVNTLAPSRAPAPPPAVFDPLPLRTVAAPERALVQQPLLTPPPAPLPRQPLDYPAARAEAVKLVKVKATQEHCAKVAQLLQDQGEAHTRGDFGRTWDRLVLDCLMLRTGVIPYSFVSTSLEREKQRTEREMEAAVASSRKILRGVDLAPAAPAAPPPAPAPAKDRSGAGLRYELPGAGTDLVTRP